MGLNTLSLKARSAIITLLALAIFTPLAILAIDKAYAATLKNAVFDQLKLTALMLISEFEFIDDAPTMPIFVYDEKLNVSESGVYGFIRWKNTLVWQSSSSDGMPLYVLPEPPESGQETFVETDTTFVYAFTAEFQTDWGFSPVHFFVVFEQEPYLLARRTFLKTLWGWMSVLNVGLFVCLLLGITLLLRPLTRLRHEIKRTISGEQTLIEKDYPVEFSPLTLSINTLIETEHAQRKRYKNSLSDLAHSLKTPLTVALGETKENANLQHPLLEIKAIIDRQLKRASATSSGFHKGIDLKPVVQKLLNAMSKVHAEKKLHLTQDIPMTTIVNMEQTDLLECLGNLVDNACKAAKKEVAITAQTQQTSLLISVEDDGPGIPVEQRTHLLTRGERLDTYEEGQGIGLAITLDIISSYGGTLVIEASALKGAKITLHLPLNSLKN